MGKKQSPVRIPFLCKTGQPISTSWRRGTKEHLFYRTSPSVCFWILRLFSFRIEEGWRAFEEEENEFLERDIKENSVKVKYQTKTAAVVVENEFTMRSLN